MGRIVAKDVTTDGISGVVVGVEGDWAFAKGEDKRTVMIASWKIDADILKNAVLAVVGVVEDKERKRKGRGRKELKK